MSVSTLYRSASGLRWNPDADALNAPADALLRADNLVPDEQGMLTLRAGSSTLFAGAADVNSIYTAEVDGSTLQAVNIGSKVFINQTQLSTSFLDGDGDALTTDVALGDDSYQLFMAGGVGKAKYSKDSDGEWREKKWGIPAPTVTPTLAAAAFAATSIANFGSGGETTAGTFVVHEGTSAYASGFDGTSNGAHLLTPATATGRASISKAFTAVQNFSTLNEQVQADTDLFDIFVWLEEPRKVDKITVMFGLGDLGAADPFQSDYYYFEFKIKDQSTVDVKDAGSTGAAAYAKSVTAVQSIVDPVEVTQVQTPAQVQDILRRLGRYAGPRSRERADAQQASPAWTHFSVTRGQFNRVGGTAAKDWSVVSAIKIVYTALPGDGSDRRIGLDTAVWYGGGARALTGTYKGTYRFVRRTSNYIELSPPSPVSDTVTVTQGNITFTIPAEGVSEADSQVNEIWCYLYGGFLDTFYRFAITGSAATSDAYRIDEFTPPDAGGIVNVTPPPTYTLPLDDAVQRGAMIAQGLSIPGGDLAGDSAISVALRKSELDVIIENEILEPGAVATPDNIVAIAGPWLNRMFALTDEGWLYVSSAKSPSNFSVYHCIDMRRYGRPLWMVKTASGITCGLTGDIVRVVGSGEESADKIQCDLYGVPLGVGNPPVDSCVHVDGSVIIYRAADGLVTLTASSTQFFPTGNTSLLWRGYDRHGVEGLNYATGRFRVTVDNGVMYLVAPEGSGTEATTVYRVYLQRNNEWCRTVYPFNIRAIYREPSGRLLIGTSNETTYPGQVIEIDADDQDVYTLTGGSTAADNIDVEIWTPISDGGAPLSRKTCHDLQFTVDTGGRTLTANVYTGTAAATGGGGGITPTSSYAVITTLAQPFRINSTDFGDFLRVQLRLVGDFYRFTLYNYALTYRSHPQMMMAFDPGYIVPAGNGDFAWLQEVEVDCISPSDLAMDIYRDDVLFDTLSIPVTANVRSVYRTPVPRNTKARRLRLRFRTTASDGQGQIGFEPYFVRYRLRPSGNQVEPGFQTLYPVGNAP